jgi:hypothetical protein
LARIKSRTINTPHCLALSLHRASILFNPTAPVS